MQERRDRFYTLSGLEINSLYTGDDLKHWSAEEDLGDPKFRPCPMLRRYVEAGWLGRKAGRGFYLYEASDARQEATSHKT